MIRKLILRLLITAVAVIAVFYIIPGMVFIGNIIEYLQVVGLIFATGLILKPILKIISIPVEIATLGIFSIIVNGVALFAVEHWLHYIKITSFWFSGISNTTFLIAPIEIPGFVTLVIAAFSVSVVSTFLYWLTK
ncbi:phage holin family protein [candidate division WWE3 bacterium]|uniref:Phage holin family protein n=1 Tax=candidate division WWE3 bacterium TaxID=2053526 RepID=A0A955LLH9_UNCKA|nr:phage holin family protein [candidate division WWE3 bacterium]